MGKKIGFVLVCLTVFGIVLWRCNDFEKEPLISNQGQSYEKAEVVAITKDNIEEDGLRYGNQEVVVKIKSGALKGQEVEATSPNGTLFGAACTLGMKVIVIVSSTEDTNVVTVYSKDRSVCIYVFLACFIGIVCFIGGKKGIKAVVSLIFTLICIGYLMFPLLYQGKSPIWVSIWVCVAATMVTLYLLGGFSKKTGAALIGTSLGVVIAAVTAILFGKAAGINGYNVAEIETLSYVGQYCALPIGELLFAGIIISSLGAVMDVGMSIASAIQEIHEANPSLGSGKLFQAGIRVGRDMMGTMTNTLILAYVGGSLTTLMIHYAYQLPYNQLLNSYNIGIEIMQGVAGSMGVVLTVPVTAFISAWMMSTKEAEEEEEWMKEYDW